MDYLALKLPGSNQIITGPDNFKFSGAKLGTVITSALDLVFIIVAVLAFIWLIWGAFQYLFAGGNKEDLGKARARMMWAVVGLILTLLSFTLAQFVEQILRPQTPSPFSFNLVSTVYAQGPAAPVGFKLGDIFGFGDIQSFGQGFGRLVAPALSIAGVAVVIYFLIGGIQLLTSSGDKGAVSSAKDKITHAIIGFLLIFLVFLIMQFIPELFGFKFRIIQ